MKENGFKEADFKSANMARTFGISFILYLISALFLAMFIGPEGVAAFGMMAGLFAALAFVGTSVGINYLFEQKSFKLWLINVSYSVVCYLIM